MPKLNSYFTVPTPFGHKRFPFDDSSDIQTRKAFAEARQLFERGRAVLDGSECLTVFRPFVWRIEEEMSLVGRISSIRHAPDPTVRGSMQVRCKLCGVSAVVRGDAAQRDRLMDAFEATHAPHWLEEVRRAEQRKHVAAAVARRVASAA